MSTKVTISTVGRDGASHSFEVEIEKESRPLGEAWKYTIRATARPGHFFQARFAPMSDGRIRPAALDHYGIEEFVAKGIPEAILQDVAARSGRTVVSSTTEGDAHESANPYELDPDAVEFRSPDADKLWKRLLAKQRATYDPVEDRYTFVP
jgi:hypothetical protein